MRTFNVTVNGKTYSVEVEELNGAVEEPVKAQPAPKMVVEQAVATKEVKEIQKPTKPVAVSGDGTKLLAPMPGMIVGFKVEAGTAVKKGQAVLILEAMKMENDIAATVDGVVSFTVAKGDNVQTGDVIAIIN